MYINLQYSNYLSTTIYIFYHNIQNVRHMKIIHELFLLVVRSSGDTEVQKVKGRKRKRDRGEENKGH